MLPNFALAVAVPADHIFAILRADLSTDSARDFADL
jgi:hypothetical protein